MAKKKATTNLFSPTASQIFSLLFFSRVSLFPPFSKGKYLRRCPLYSLYRASQEDKLCLLFFSVVDDVEIFLSQNSCLPFAATTFSRVRMYGRRDRVIKNDPSPRLSCLDVSSGLIFKAAEGNFNLSQAFQSLSFPATSPSRACPKEACSLLKTSNPNQICSASAPER